MAVIKKGKNKTISTRKGTIVVRVKKEPKSAGEKIDDGLRKATKKIDNSFK